MSEKYKIKLAVWGTGGFSGNILSYNRSWLKNIDIAFFVSNSHTLGIDERFLGVRVLSPAEIKDESWDYIVILSTYFKEIRVQIIEELNIPEEKIISLEKLAKNLVKEKGISILDKKVLLYGKNYKRKNYIFHLKQRVEKLNIIDDGTNNGIYVNNMVKLSDINKERWDYVLLLDDEEGTEDILKENIEKVIYDGIPILKSSEWLCNLAFECRKERKKGEKFYYSIIPIPRAGLMALFAEFIRSCNDALSKGYLPFIDMQNSSNMYLEEDKIEKENAWEYYFTQAPYVSGKSLNKIYKEENIIIPSMYMKSASNIDLVKNKQARIDLRKTRQELFRVQDEIIKKANIEYQRVFSGIDNIKVLGCIYRGTDFKNVKPANHPIPPDLNEFAETLKLNMKKWNCEYVFLATEDEDALEYMKGVFNNKLLYINQVRYRNTGDKFLAEIENNRPNDRYLRGLEYMTAIICLTKCNYLIASRTGGLSGTLLLKENDFDDMYIFNKGKYSAENKNFL